MKNVVEKSDRLVYCVDCDSWDATLDRFLTACRTCASPHIHQGPHASWARRFQPHLGYVTHGSLRIAVMPGSRAFHVLSTLREMHGLV